MPDPTPIERALCCGPTCGRSRPEHGECVAATHGRRRREALEAAGYQVIPIGGAAILAAGYELVSVDELASLREILRLGITACHAQNTYFRDRSRDNLVASKVAEKAFDDAARAAIAAEGQGT